MSNSKWPKAFDESLPEIELYSSTKERTKYDNEAEFYSIIMATEYLERAYAQAAITEEQYRTQCSELLKQFNIAERAALGGGYAQGAITEEQYRTQIRAFMKRYDMDCPRAYHRLVVERAWERNPVPEPVPPEKLAAISNEITEHFITAMDAVKLEMRAMEELQPLLSDLMNALIQLPETPNAFPPNIKVREWLKKFNAMRAVERIDEDDATQLRHDLNDAYIEFKRFVNAKK
ncbi:hypothetical protein ACHAXA_001973 [Cyclostephanos tholiformis]|jgi:ESCRT-I complex subunit VPS28|uniref:Vacuolar protein sorting-associated protein 28 homolog n=1 Tax=Cyclostephanos tholiformis TaxID=382380 RepID=A0ABD3SDX7_9STRA